MKPTEDNPLLRDHLLPEFSKIKPEHIEPAIDYLLKSNREIIEELVNQEKPFNWDNTIGQIEALDDRLNRAWSPVNHLNAVADNEALRKVYNRCIEKLSEYSTDLGQHEGLYNLYKTVADSKEYDTLSTAQKKIIDNALRDFRLAGIELSESGKQRFKKLQLKLSKLQTRFEENLLDATNAWKKHITDVSELEGLPESALSLAAQTARREGVEGWLLNLEFPSFMPVMKYAQNRALRQEMYTAYVTRASEQASGHPQWDNTEIMHEILAARYELARLLDYQSYAHYSLARKMASKPEEVLDFLYDLAERSRDRAKEEYRELEHFARQRDTESLEAWDIAFYSEKLRQYKYKLSQEELKPYFPLPSVLKGLFTIVHKLYRLDIRSNDTVDTWHPDVRFFDIYDAEGTLRGSFYLDLYARPHKRGGAWMDECVVRKKTAEGIQPPVAYLTCNFTPPIGDDPALLTHDEVTTLFHEFGHGLHHMLTRVDYAGVSGINGVPWDAVELPSQFMENWCWERDSLDLIGEHYKTGEKISDDLFQRLYHSKTFQSGMQMVRQLEFALFDYKLHLDYTTPHSVDIQSLLNKIRDEVAVVRPPAFNRFQHSFSHIFAGGYAAGYYSYKWAEVLSADAFSFFEETGIFNEETGQSFLSTILEQGGSRDPLDLFVEFRGREPRIDALLRHSGIAA